MGDFEKITTFKIMEEPELHAVHNLPGQVHRSQISRRILGECKIRAELKKVHYGVFGGSSASLIVVEFKFLGSNKLRYTSASIKIAFEAVVSENKSQKSRTPVVRDYFPWKI